jgi:hypothetical protein
LRQVYCGASNGDRISGESIPAPKGKSAKTKDGVDRLPKRADVFPVGDPTGIQFMLDRCAFAVGDRAISRYRRDLPVLFPDRKGTVKALHVRVCDKSQAIYLEILLDGSSGEEDDRIFTVIEHEIFWQDLAIEDLEAEEI